MKRFLLTLCALSAAFTVVTAQEHEFYVSTAGNDEWSGKFSAPNTNRTDGPLRTLAGARDRLRSLKEKGLLSGGVTVNVRGGRYTIDNTFLLTARDSGTGFRPTIWRAYRGEQVFLSGGRTIAGFRPVTDPAVRARLGAAAGKHVLVTNLKSQGITAYGEIGQRGGPPMELFVNGRRMTLARYPDEGWLHIADVPQTGDSMYNRGLEREKRYNDVPAGRHFGRITYDGNEPSRWAVSDDIFVQGYWTFDWSDSYQRIGSIDTVKREITLRPPPSLVRVYKKPEVLLPERA